MKRLVFAFAVLLVCSVAPSIASAQNFYSQDNRGNQTFGSFNAYNGYGYAFDNRGHFTSFNIQPDYSAPYRRYYQPIYQPYYAPIYRPYYSPGFYQSPYMAGYRLPGYGF